MEQRIKRLEQGSQDFIKMDLQPDDISFLRGFLIDRLVNGGFANRTSLTREQALDHLATLSATQLVAECERLWDHPSGLRGLLETGREFMEYCRKRGWFRTGDSQL